MRKLHDIDKLARDGTRLPPAYTPDNARWDAMQARLEQSTGRRKSPAAWWIWALTGALVLTGGLALWFSTQRGLPAEPLQAQRAAERPSVSSLQHMPLSISVTPGGSTSTSMSSTEAVQGTIRTSEAWPEYPGTGNTTAPSNSAHKPSTKQDGLAQQTQEPHIAEAEPHRTEAGDVSGSPAQEGDLAEESVAVENQSGKQDPTGTEVHVSGFDKPEQSTFGPWQLAPEAETTAGESDHNMSPTGDAAPDLAEAAEAHIELDFDLLHQYPYLNSLALPAIPDHDFRQQLAHYKGTIPKWTVYLDFGNRILPSWTNGNLLLLNPHVGAGIGYRPGAHLQLSAGLRGYIRHAENLMHSVDHISYSFGRDTERYTQHLKTLWYLEMPLGMEYLAGSRIWIGAGLNPAWLLTTRSEIVISQPGQPGESPVKQEPGRHYLDGLTRFDVSADARMGYRLTELTDLYLRAHIGLKQVPDGSYFDHTGSGRSNGIVIGLKHQLK